MRIIKVKNGAKLGDCIYSINILNKITKVNDVIFYFYIQPIYFNEIQEHIINHENIKLFPIEESDSECYQLWYGWIMYNDNPYMKMFSDMYNQGIFDPFFINFFNKFCNDLKLISPIKDVKDVLYENPNLLIKNELCYEHDYFIINCPALSGQYTNYSHEEFVNLCKNLLEKGNKIITVNDVGMGIPNTVSLGFNTLQIGAISLYSKNIIGVDTAPMHPCVNLYNYDYFLNNKYNLKLLVKYNLNLPHVKTFDTIREISI